VRFLLLWVFSDYKGSVVSRTTEPGLQNVCGRDNNEEAASTEHVSPLAEWSPIISAVGLHWSDHFAVRFEYEAGKC
jgi:hypothetical protein